MSTVVTVLVWWAVLFGVWVLTLSTASSVELVAAAVAGLGCALTAPLVRRITGVSWKGRRRWLSWLGPLPLAAAVETVLVLGSIPARRAGQWKQVELPTEDSESRSVGRRAAATFVLSATPGTYVVDSPPGEPLLTHTIATGRPRLDRVVTR